MERLFVLLPLFLIALSFKAMGEDVRFKSAKPVWPEGREREKNVSVAFRAVFDCPKGDPVILRVAASTLYRAFVNGQFCGHGPARGPHEWYRVDEWPLAGKLAPGAKVVAIEVAGYNVNSYYLLDQPAFLQAEVLAGDKIVASTAGGGAAFVGRVEPERVQKVERYSFQRPFIEVYRLGPGYDAWRKDPGAPFEPTPCAVAAEKKLLRRHVPYPAFSIAPALQQVSHGTVAPRTDGGPVRKDRHLLGIGPKLGGFPYDELEIVPSLDVQHLTSSPPTALDAPMTPEASITMRDNTYSILDFGMDLTGFAGATIVCAKPTRLYFTFDEILNEGHDLNFLRLGCVNAITYDLEPGRYEVESFEPYTLRYLKLIVTTGECDVTGVHLRQYKNPDVERAQFSAADERLNRLFTAGVETFSQNAVDIFMDCPSRERAGWLCDSFFTARVANDLGGNTSVERNFFENFRLPERFAHLPEGMLPMCYPADHYDGVFIPNWALWFVLQLEEYAARSGDREMADSLKPKVLALFDYFKRFKNEDGLLEKLENWVFVEWSKANNFVQDVNYPSNMLYASALAAAGRLYGMPELAAEAEKIRETVRKQSYDGAFFVDNAVRKDGRLEVTRNRTEVCQYFALYFDVASPQSHPELWRTLRDDFGPQRAKTKAFPEVHPANSFVGNMLRVEILSRYGRCQQILDESIDYLLYMAERTGTLWENVDAGASCDHGFASHIVHTLYRDIAGIYALDTVNKTVHLRFSDVKMDHCAGTMPVPEGAVSFQWRQDGGKIIYKLEAPAGYTIRIENLSGKELVAESA